jgi:hypothetical protein
MMSVISGCDLSLDNTRRNILSMMSVISGCDYTSPRSPAPKKQQQSYGFSSEVSPDVKDEHVPLPGLTELQIQYQVNATIGRDSLRDQARDSLRDQALTQAYAESFIRKRQHQGLVCWSPLARVRTVAKPSPLRTCHPTLLHRRLEDPSSTSTIPTKGADIIYALPQLAKP